MRGLRTGVATGYLILDTRCRRIPRINLGAYGGVIGGSHFTQECDSVEFGDGFEEGVFDATFVHQETFEDFGV